jgi:hypothetical protein
MGEIPRADVTAAWNAEGETPIRRGKLSGKRTVIHRILWREPVKGPPKGKAQSFRAEGNLSGKRTGELRNCSEVPLSFLVIPYDGFRIGFLPHGAGKRGEIHISGVEFFVKAYQTDVFVVECGGNNGWRTKNYQAL